MKKFLFSIASAAILTATLFLSSCNPETITSTEDKDETSLMYATSAELENGMNVYTLALLSDGASIYSPQEGDYFYGIAFFRRKQ